ncbi:hypothetical protein FAZ69_22350 [Trinickia terrae]|uniref:Uncharacterized protein n=2 Tax=Trinickia terrae TaxID=2571161 RepID=A0A4V5PJB9_9BURK|nr:hypothetical protein FAZ69_22350 [Trinickia terrae]
MEVTGDGQYLLIRGDRNTAAIHRSVFNDLLVGLPNAIERSERMTQRSDAVRFALHCQGWEIGRIDGTQNLVIRFRLSENAGLSFSLPCFQVPDMLTALSAAAGLSQVSPQPQLTLQ